MTSKTRTHDSGLKDHILWGLLSLCVLCAGCATVPTDSGSSGVQDLSVDTRVSFFFQEGFRVGSAAPIADLITPNRSVLVINTGRESVDRALRERILREQDLQYFENGLNKRLKDGGVFPLDKTQLIQFQSDTAQRTQWTTPLDVSNWSDLSMRSGGARVLIDYSFVEVKANSTVPDRPRLTAYLKIIDLQRDGAILWAGLVTQDKPHPVYTMAREAARTLPSAVVTMLSRCILVDMNPSLGMVGGVEPLSSEAQRMIQANVSLTDKEVRKNIEAGLVSGITSLKPGCILEKLPTLPERPLWRFLRLSFYADPLEQELTGALTNAGCSQVLYYRSRGTPGSFFVKLVDLKQRRVIWAGTIGSPEKTYYSQILAHIRKTPPIVTSIPSGSTIVLAEDSLMLPSERSRGYTPLHAECAEALTVALLFTQPALSQRLMDLYVEPLNSNKYERVETLHNPFVLKYWQDLAAQGVTTAFLYDVVKQDGMINTHIKRIDTATGTLVDSTLVSLKEVR